MANTPEQHEPLTESEISEQKQVRLDKRERMIEAGLAPYPLELPITAKIADVVESHQGLEADVKTGDIVGVAGRIVHLRNTGKLCFAALQDGDGRIQAMISLAEVGEESLAQWKEFVDLGDQIFVQGEVITSRRGELSIMATEWKMASKALRPLPNLHTELNEETRVRQRYLDLINRPAARQMVQTRALANASLRQTFAENGFLEVETPMLQTLHGGAAARPFSTHSNAFDTDLFLRIAPELYLKRALVGGLDRVFEINRNFRNEGADSTHSPEFAMLEAYQAYGDYNSIADLTQQLVQNAARAVSEDGSAVVTWADGTQFDLGGDWPRISMYESLSEKSGVEVTPSTSVEELQALADREGVEVKLPNHGKLVEELWEHFVKGELEKPVFVVDFPMETSPLTAAHRSKPGVVEKWDLYVRGFELATGYSELIDPIDQRERFVEQARESDRGDVEAMHLDEDFLTALEYGMPPAGGMGMGIDRLLMALTGLGIRETVLFPLVK
ncbi:lysine--tRNA ligase [Gulosibacter molinativorax]|uniref:Lysine--tRNA ligase n=1 Tax=Gulosibacter molinativorax TaxID=256821 RepID=A0ABT7C6W4_9MICO|nr:lysine--tRNA ligase [Gulosibacter molinativorax]MDJ1370929.1 lysine--tRNA ligase [Gulosibacter molinativorax]QUY62719.1 Lysine--tRNA ligase [Gulosibacter molinativorax]